jgi:hypothetical protein
MRFQDEDVSASVEKSGLLSRLMITIIALAIIGIAVFGVIKLLL